MSDIPQRLADALADRYVLEREIGAGGMATVYLARDVRHKRSVAVKVVRPELGGRDGVERFLREIELAARLQHPHILPVFDSGAVTESAGGSVPYFVMPYVEGETLRQRLQREGRLPVETATTLAAEVADALGLCPRARRGAPRHQAGKHPAERRPRGGRRFRCGPGARAGGGG